MDGWFRRRKKVNARQERLAEIAALGFEVIEPELDKAQGYMLRSPDGVLLDNLGMGYANTQHALNAAKRHVEARKVNPGTMSLVIAAALFSAPGAAVAHRAHGHRVPSLSLHRTSSSERD